MFMQRQSRTCFSQPRLINNMFYHNLLEDAQKMYRNSG